MNLNATAQVEKAFATAWQRLPLSGRVVLAVSGGIDSMVLLECAARHAGKIFQSQRLLVAHVNHALRGEESDADEALVLEAASRLGLESRSLRLSWHGERTSQNACRKRREAFFASLLGSIDDRIFFAHHLNDQAETVMFRLIRGTGAKGLKGMLPASGRKLRPFLALEKRVLAAAAKAWSVRWREDRSNLTLGYERNWIRSLFPLIEARRPGFQGKLAALAEEARGWELSPRSLEHFSHREGITFSCPNPEASTAILAHNYALNRRHSVVLRELLQKSGGKLEAEGVRFTWSAGVLLAERAGAKFSASLTSKGGREWESGLGTWIANDPLQLHLSGGDSAKKEFQALRVPVFFRAAIPLVADSRGRLLALLPERIAKFGSLDYSPSALAEWWLAVRS